MRLDRRPTPSEIATVASAVRSHLPIPTAAALARVPASTLRAWIAEGETDREAARDTPCAALADAVAIGTAEGERALAHVVSAAATTDPKWAWRLLERRYPEGWGPARDVPPPAPPAPVVVDLRADPGTLATLAGYARPRPADE